MLCSYNCLSCMVLYMSVSVISTYMIFLSITLYCITCIDSFYHSWYILIVCESGFDCEDMSHIPSFIFILVCKSRMNRMSCLINFRHKRLGRILYFCIIVSSFVYSKIIELIMRTRYPVLPPSPVSFFPFVVVL